VIASLWALDTLLESAQTRAVQSEAQHSYAEGIRFRNAGRLSEAVDSLRKAYAFARTNTTYELALIQSLIDAGKIDEAQRMLNEVLEVDSNNGEANLLAARLMVRKRRFSDADSYYHRAIYGAWPDDAEQHQTSARLELAELLVKQGNRRELLAELLPLEAEPGSSTGTEQRLAHLFLIAGSAKRSAEVYHSLIIRNPEDGGAYAGLGEAELEAGDYRAARTAFEHAALHQGNSRTVQELAGQARELSEMDPTPRWLPSAEKYRRSLHILDLAREAFEQCATGNGSNSDPETQKLIEAAEDKLAAKPPAHISNEIAESVLVLAQQIWARRLKACGQLYASDETLRLLMTKLSQG